MSSDSSPSIVRFGRGAANSLRPIVTLITRLVIGIAFVLGGWGKWQNLEGTATFFEKLGIPAPGANAAFIASLELVGGACLVLGFGTRLFGALLSATMIVAILSAHRQEFLDALPIGAEKDLTDVVPFVFLLFLGWLVAYGPGAISLDRAVFGSGREES